MLQAEATRQIHDTVNNELHAKERRIRNLATGLTSLAVVFLLFSLARSFTWMSLALLATALAGVATGYFLLAKELGVTYKAIDAFCNAGKNTNCDKVLKTDIRLWGVSFSDVVVIYFIFQVVALGLAQTLPAIRETFVQALAVLGILSLPVILFSLYYQYAVAKTWCRLCLVVVAVLLTQLAIYTLGYFSGAIQLVNVQVVPLGLLALLFAAIGFSIIMVKSILERANKLNRLAGSSNRVKYSASVFNHLLKQQREVNTQPFGKEMLLGNPDAPVKIMMVSNLYCNPCKEKHRIVDELISIYPDQVSVALRFVRSKNETVGNLNAGSYVLGAWLTHCHGKADEGEKTRTLLHDWFELWDLQKFAHTYTVDKDQEEPCQALEAQHSTWTQETQVQFTPAFFVNGCQLPKEYSIYDLIVMIPALADVSMEENKSIEALQGV